MTIQQVVQLGYEKITEHINELDVRLADMGRQLSILQHQSNVDLEKYRAQKRANEWAMRDNHLKNVELDALYHVWCDGNCKTGTLRFTGGHRGPLSEEVVRVAEMNTSRMRRRWNNMKAKEERNEAR